MGRAMSGDNSRWGDAYILVLYVFEELELAVGALGKYRGAKRLHDLLDRDGGAC